MPPDRNILHEGYRRFADAGAEETDQPGIGGTIGARASRSCRIAEFLVQVQRDTEARRASNAAAPWRHGACDPRRAAARCEWSRSPAFDSSYPRRRRPRDPWNSVAGGGHGGLRIAATPAANIGIEMTGPARWLIMPRMDKSRPQPRRLAPWQRPARVRCDVPPVGCRRRKPPSPTRSAATRPDIRREGRVR